MRSTAAVAALFAAGAVAGPFHNAHQHLHAKRDMVIVTDIDIVYETVWVTEGAEPTEAPAAAPTTTVEAAAAPAPTVVQNWRGGQHSHSWKAPSSSSSVYVAPTTTEVYTPPPAPTTTEAPPAPSTTAAAASSTASSYSSGGPINLDDYQAAVLLHHNVHRANHSAPDIEWDDNLASIAESEAAVCVYAHNVTGGGGGYGQNIAAGVHSDNISVILSDMFYNAEMTYYAGMYGETNPDFTNFEKYGHFTQMVWKGTTKVGCATYDCSSSGLGNVGSDVAPYFTVCNYGPPGNMGGEYGDNIGSPSGQPTVNWAYTG